MLSSFLCVCVCEKMLCGRSSFVLCHSGIDPGAAGGKKKRGGSQKLPRAKSQAKWADSGRSPEQTVLSRLSGSEGLSVSPCWIDGEEMRDLGSFRWMATWS